MNKMDCKNINCIERIKMLNWKNTTKPKYWEDKKNLDGIIKCNNPNCPQYFNYIDYENSIEFMEVMKENE